MTAAIPEFPDFTVLEIAHRDAFLKIADEERVRTSERSFGNLVLWRHPVRTHVARLAGGLCIRWGVPGEEVFTQPMGVAPALFDAAIRASVEPPVTALRVEEEYAAALEGLGWSIAPDRNNWDYVYLADDLAELSGRRFDGKRNHIKTVTDAHDCRYEALTPALAGECLALQKRWCKAKACDESEGLSWEDKAVKLGLASLEEVGLFGGTVFVDGELEAFCIAERLNHDTAVVHFEKASPEIPGLYQLINYWFARKALRGRFTYVNREQDLGIEGLRRAKESYYPHHMVRKYTAVLAG